MSDEQENTAEAAAVDTGETTAEKTVETEEVAQAATQEETGETPAPRKQTAQERIDEIYRKQKDAEREAVYWRKVALEREQAGTPPPKESASQQIAGLPPRPKLDQFDTTEAYEDALLDWGHQKREIAASAATQRAEQEKALKNFNKAAEKLRREHEDFDDAINSPVFSPTMSLILTKSENGPLVAYHLGKAENRDAADRIRDLPAEMQIYEIAKLEQQLLIAQNTKKIPGAPPPIKPVGSTGGGADKDPSKMSTEEWMEWDRQRTQAKIKEKYGG